MNTRRSRIFFIFSCVSFLGTGSGACRGGLLWGQESLWNLDVRAPRWGRARGAGLVLTNAVCAL